MTEKIVAHYKDGKVLKGTEPKFSLNREDFHMTLLSGEIKKIQMEELKGVFFVKRHEGNRDYKCKYQDCPDYKGDMVGVKFQDGESIAGYSEDYGLTSKGFFMTPADPEGNNISIYVVNSATAKVLSKPH